MTLGGGLFDQGATSLKDIGNKYKDNEVVGGLVAGSFIDAAKTQMNLGSSLQYNTAMSSHLMGLQQGLENLKTGNQMKLMGAEGRIAKDLIGAQGVQQRFNIAATGEEQRKGIRETGAQTRLNLGVAGQQERLNIGARGVEDRSLARTQGSEQRKGIRTAGEQERLNIGKRYQEERGMRADARGAIRSLGARFFG